MDDIVRQAMAKWPHVPHCYGWLGLDARGGWHMRDDRVQALGPFPQSRGALLRHDKLIEFIHRNYERDAQGCWYFQNGPQRVYVELEDAPLVLRIDADGGVTAHTGKPAQVAGCYLDESGRLYLDTDLGLGRVHTQDMLSLSDALEARRWPLIEVPSLSLPARYGYVLSPQARQAGEKKAG